MTEQLLHDLEKAIEAHEGHPFKVELPSTNRVYVIVDNDTHDRAMRALQQQNDLAAIQAGIDDMEAGRVTPVAEADALLRERLGYPAKEQ